MSISLSVPTMNQELTAPKITVIGIGGAGGNAVNNMIRSNLEGAEFIVGNTDAQALTHSLAEKRIQLGASLTSGLGAGSKPDIGRGAAEEARDEILSYLQGSNMVFITAGMGGGTGTGAAPVVAKLAREQGILTVGVVTKPFHFEGAMRMRTAESGIKELAAHVDTLIIIPNQNLFRIANEKTTFADAFRMADDVLYAGVRGITDLMVMPGLINLDFADIRTVMTEMGKAMMGTGDAEGDNRAIDAAEAAIANPLLDDVSMRGARGVLINITGGPDMTLFEVDEAANRIREEVDPNANIIFGSTFDESIEGRIRVSIVATGIEQESQSKGAVSTNLFAQFDEEKSTAEDHQVIEESAPASEVANEESAPASAYTEAQAPENQKPQDNPSSEQKSFVPPQPAMPEDYVRTPSTHAASRPAVMPQEKPLSFFERMTNLGKRKTPQEQNHQHDSHTNQSHSHKKSPDLFEDIDKETINIPTFLRKNK